MNDFDQGITTKTVGHFFGRDGRVHLLEFQYPISLAARCGESGPVHYTHRAVDCKECMADFDGNKEERQRYS
jgi:hypothetical protein